MLSSRFDLERPFPGSSCPQTRGLETEVCPIKDHRKYTGMCSLPSKLFLAFEESPLKHKCQVCSNKGP